jgi:hypothetical protein
MRNESASIIMIAGANCDQKAVCQLSDELRNLTRLLRPGFKLEDVEQITGKCKRGRSLELVRSANETSECDNGDQRSKGASWFREMLVQSRPNVIRCSRTEKAATQF